MNSQPYRLFPPFRLDAVNAQLWRDNEEISLRPKTFDVLRYLVNHPGQLVTKAMLLDAVWPGVVVSDTMPATCVKELRRLLGDETNKPRFIETVHRRGYRFVAKVTTAKDREASRVPPGVPKRPKPILVGRDEDLARLKSWYSQVFEGQRRVVFIAGEAGIGKSAFAQAFLDSIPEDAATRVAWGQCIQQYGSGEPYMPVLEGLMRLGQASDGERVVEILRRLAPTWLAQMPGVLGPDERNQLPSEVPGMTQQRMLREITQALEALAAESPLLLLLEDLHWSDFSTLELISAIARRVESAQLMILGTYRPVEMLVNDHPLRTMKEELELHRYCEELRLNLLKETDIAAYLAQRFSGSDSQRYVRFAPVIHARTDGNPLFMISVVDYLVDEGIVTNSRELRATDVLMNERLEAPRSIRQMIERNFERLKPYEQAVLEGASVAGAEFSIASVAAALDRPQDEIEACCTRLSRHEQFVSTQGPIAWPDGTIAAGFRFNHALYQEVLYNRLPVGHRLQLHRRIATREEAGYGERVGEVATELAYHFSRANDKHKAIQYFRLAGERALVRSAMIEAERHYRDAAQLLLGLPENAERDHLELALRLGLGSALHTVRGVSSLELESTYRRARELCERLGNPPMEFSSASFGLWATYSGRGELRKSYALAEQFLVWAESLPDRSFVPIAKYTLGDNSYWLGNFSAAKDHLEAAIGVSESVHNLPLTLRHAGLNPEVLRLIYTALTSWQLGFPDQALNVSRKAVAISKAPLHLPSLYLAENYLAVVHQIRGEVFAVEQTVESVEALCADHGLADWMAWTALLRGWAMVAKGRDRDGIAQQRGGLAVTAATGSKVWQPHFLCVFAENCTKIGVLIEGLNALTETLKAANEQELRYCEAEAYRLTGELLLRQDSSRAVEAIEYFERAITVARRQKAKSFELRATTNLARLMVSQGRLNEARTKLAEIYHWFTEGLGTADLSDAKALLESH